MARGRKAAAVDAGPVEGPWDLPDGWRWERLGNLVEKSSAKHQPDKESRLPFVGLEHIPPHEMRIEGVGSFAVMRSAGSAFLPGDVLYGRLRPYLNKVWVADRAGACSGELLVLRPKAGMDARYVALNLHSQRYVYYASHIVTGDRPRIDFDLVGAFPVPVPDEGTQRQVVARIDALFAEIDEGEAALAEARAGVETYRKALLKAAVTGELTSDWRAANPPQETGEHLLARILADRRARWHADPKNARKKYTEPAGPDTDGLPELPEGWAWASLQQIAFISGGATVDAKRRPDDPVEVPYLRVANVQRGALNLSKMKTITIERTKLADLALMPGDILLNEGGDRDKVGRGWIWEGQLEICAHQNHVFKARPVSEAIEPKLVSMYLNELGRKFFLDESKQTTNLASISLTKVARAPVAIPPASEATAILAALEANIDAAIEAPEIARAEDAASTLRQSILAAAFRGELTA
ncbi:MAG: hypothetical protein ABL907_19915 [Hyphomicrobium sp.]